ncbi:Hypothetical predicted protein [Marmota monax]|uniref:Uncharacterized protein n=1 Tax=Marmota monax TaxID=9995 RepID=A0A5E4ATJ3_MARMO|nr:Hypothetical predicted protein [Marmota monax]
MPKQEDATQPSARGFTHPVAKPLPVDPRAPPSLMRCCGVGVTSHLPLGQHPLPPEARLPVWDTHLPRSSRPLPLPGSSRLCGLWDVLYNYFYLFLHKHPFIYSLVYSHSHVRIATGKTVKEEKFGFRAETTTHFHL